MLLTSSCGEQAFRTHNCVMQGEECPHAETRIGPQGRKGDEGVPGPIGPVGPSGPEGDTGESGSDGNDAENCTVESTPSGAEITCPDGSVATVSNGSNGTNGADAPLAITEIVDPCGDSPGVQDEVLLRLGNGSLVVLLADNPNGHNPRLAVLGAGNYLTSDGSNCYFTITPTNAIINQHF